MLIDMAALTEAEVQLLQSRRVSLDEVFVREIGKSGGPQVAVGTPEVAL